MTPSRQSLHQFVVLALVTAAVASLAGSWTDTTVRSWYPMLRKPSWTPPSYVFGPIWTLLYALMTIAAWRVWRLGGWTSNRPALALYFVQLVLNAAWSGLFFGLRRPDLALIDIGVLLVCVLATYVLFDRVDRWAGILMVPYVVWLSLAAALNAAIWRMN